MKRMFCYLAVALCASGLVLISSPSSSERHVAVDIGPGTMVSNPTVAVDQVPGPDVIDQTKT